MKRASALVVASLLVLAGCSSSTPQSCTDALDAADRLNSTVERYMQHALAGAQAGSDALRAASDSNPAGIDAATDAIEDAAADMAAVAPDLNLHRNAYETAAKRCRAA